MNILNETKILFTLQIIHKNSYSYSIDTKKKNQIYKHREKCIWYYRYLLYVLCRYSTMNEFTLYWDWTETAFYTIDRENETTRKFYVSNLISSHNMCSPILMTFYYYAPCAN